MTQKHSHTENTAVWLNIAERAARAAGDVLKREFVRGSEVKLEQGKDIKLVADVLAEETLLKILRTESGHPVLSEEAGADKDFGNSRYRWVVDPLDGTFNYSRRLPLCCVSVALWEDMKPLVGAIYDFSSDVMYSGDVRSGAWRNGVPMRVSTVADPTKAAICTGFPAGSDFGRDSLMGLVRQVQQYKKVRMVGSAALSLAFVAAGFADAYQEDNIHFWDVAGGIALVVAAGGRYRMAPGANKWQFDVAVDNGVLAGA